MTIIGIDLGTTNSVCAVLKPEGVELIPNRLGDYLTPSVVGLDDEGRITVGRVAKDRLINHSDKTVAAFKRLMGTQHEVTLGKRSFTATELSAIVLRSLKEDAENYLGESVDQAVISVPAYFNENQRVATKTAGELAGFRVDRLINEPTAAAMAYGLHEQREGTFLILDMGGGTFDVSILEFFDGVMEVHASAGDNFLGGEDFVEAMVTDVLANEKITKNDINEQQLQNLYMQMETAKRRISMGDNQTVTLQLGNRELRWQMTDEWFSRIATPLLLRAKHPIERALSDASMSPGDIDDVLLVGGSTRMRLFRNMIGRLFGRIPSGNIDPDQVVAMGAAVQAGLLAKSEALDDVVLTDVCPYTLGTEVHDRDGSESVGYFLPIIERNTTVPISIVRTLQTLADNQKHIEVHVYQGESRLVEKNVYLGSVKVNVPAGPAGKEKVDIRYSYDMNGLLEVDVVVVSTGKVVSKVIEQAPGALSDAEKKRSHEKLAALKFHPRDQEVNRAVLAKGERIYESSLGERREYVAKLMAEFDHVLNRQVPAEIKRARARLDEILQELDTEEWF